MEPIEYNKFTMEELIEKRKELASEILEHELDEKVLELKRMLNELNREISKMQFYRSRNTI